MNALWIAEKVANWKGNIDVKNIRVQMKRADFYIKIDTKLPSTYQRFVGLSGQN
jgi:hypothetical protein